jgi:small subunit ribosomal protein S20
VRGCYPRANMANIKSQIKRNRQAAGLRMRNKQVRSFLRTKAKRVEEALESGDEAAASEAYRVAAREYDRAAAKGVVHKNKAANAKSRLARRLNASG